MIKSSQHPRQAGTFGSAVSVQPKQDRAETRRFGLEKYEKKAFDKMKEANIEVVQVADKTPFQNAVKPVWEKYGPKYAEMIKRIQAVQ